MRAKLVLPDHVYDQLAEDSLIRMSHEPARAAAHRAWLQNITDRVNRRLGNR